MAIQIKANEQYFSVVLFIMLYKMILTFEFVDEICVINSKDKHESKRGVTDTSRGSDKLGNVDFFISSFSLDKILKFF